MKKFLSILCSISLLFWTVGCTDINKDDIPDQVPNEKERVSTYAMVVKDTSNPYMMSMYKGFDKACKELEVNAIYQGSNSTDSIGQTEVIYDLIAKKVSVIAVAANDAKALEPSLTAAREKGIKVISLDSAVSPGSRLLHVQQASPEKIGRVLVQAAANMIDYSGQMAILSATESAPNQTEWVDWMVKEFEENQELYKDIQLVPTVYGNDDADLSEIKTYELLQAYPGLDIIISPTVVGLSAAAKVINGSGRAGDIKVTGLGLPSQMAEYIRSGICPWMYLWNVIDAGYLAAYSAYALDTEQIQGNARDTFLAGTLGTKAVGESSDEGTEVLLGDPFKLDAQNIGIWETLY